MQKFSMNRYVDESMAEDTALVLAAHGSSDDARCAAPVMRLALELRAAGTFAQVDALFWKQDPRFCEVYKRTSSPTIFVVPMMMAGGYYTRTVLPREMRLLDPPAGRTLCMTRPIGELPEMTEHIIGHATEASDQAGLDGGDAHLLIVGHGTRRDARASGATTHMHAARIARRSIFRSVHAAFLEQDPLIADAIRLIKSTFPVIVVPFLMADGTHSMTDIRQACGAMAGCTTHRGNDRLIVFAKAVGEGTGLTRMVSTAVQAMQRATQREEAVSA
jgi:sirohydrochlorin ferrochelatase